MLRIVLGMLAIVITATIFFELVTRALVPYSSRVRVLIHRQSSVEEVKKARSLQELIEGSFSGYTPFRRHCGFILNSKSLHTKEYGDQKLSGKMRLIILGDSLAFDSGCIGNSRLWPALVQSELEGSQWEVLNLARPSVGIPFYERMWDLEGSRLGADIVVIALSISTDLSDHYKVIGEKNPSYGLRLVQNLINAMRGSAPSGQGENQLRYSLLAQESERLLRSSRRIEKQAPKAIADLNRLVNKIKQNGAQVVVVLAPLAIQVDPRGLNVVLAQRGVDLSSLEFFKPQRIVSALLEGNAIPYIDLFPTLSKAAKTQSVLNEGGDLHWNELGNQLVASALLPVLKQMMAQKQLLSVATPP